MLTSGKVWGDFRREAKVKLGKERGSITWALRGQAVGKGVAPAWCKLGGW